MPVPARRTAADLPVVAIVGATATGKSELALDLAERLDGEIVGADASQLYRGMDIGTAKTPLSRRRGIPHHQVDVLDVTDEASVAAYQWAAREDMRSVRAGGRVPIVVGGSGLYVRAALDRLQIPPTDPTLRRRLEEQLQRDGVAAMHRRLTRADPEAARVIEPRNGRRIVRALEVVELTGTPFAASMPAREHAEPTITIGLHLDRRDLDERIAARTQRMWDHGLVAEVRGLLAVGLREGRTASRALGYAQAIAQLDGELTQDEAVVATAAATRRFARRQESWFRADPRVVWLPAAAPDLADRAASLLAWPGSRVGDNDRDG